jgi:hypothetical protein
MAQEMKVGTESNFMLPFFNHPQFFFGNHHHVSKFFHKNQTLGNLCGITIVIEQLLGPYFSTLTVANLSFQTTNL